MPSVQATSGGELAYSIEGTTMNVISCSIFCPCVMCIHIWGFSILILLCAAHYSDNSSHPVTSPKPACHSFMLPYSNIGITISHLKIEYMIMNRCHYLPLEVWGPSGPRLLVGGLFDLLTSSFAPFYSRLVPTKSLEN